MQDYFWANGAFKQILLWTHFAEVFGSVALYDTMTGGDRIPGYFGLDPLGLAGKPGTAKFAKFQTNEIKNGRLAMIACGGRKFLLLFVLSRRKLLDNLDTDLFSLARASSDACLLYRPSDTRTMGYKPGNSVQFVPLPGYPCSVLSVLLALVDLVGCFGWKKLLGRSNSLIVL